MLDHLYGQYMALDAPNKASLVLLAAMILALLVGIGVRLIKNAGESMLTAKEKQDISDGLTDMLLDLHAQGKLSTQKVNRMHMNFAKQHGLWDLHPRKLIQDHPHPADLKEDIEKRINKGDAWVTAVESFKK